MWRFKYSRSLSVIVGGCFNYVLLISPRGGSVIECRGGKEGGGVWDLGNIGVSQRRRCVQRKGWLGVLNGRGLCV